eukprot:m.104836 g.104836  ORF g.104836 m.104836 type:complete len:1742 (-) comp13860_c1_seq2:37-5262(-)
MGNEDWLLDPHDSLKYRAIDWNLTKKHELPPECSIKGINRHNDILPNPRTRVVLQKVGNDPGTTYVNANYVRGHGDKKKQFIASMGPKETGQQHFWRMIWENKVHAIVMTTNTEEKGKDKCATYWPQGEGSVSKHGDIEIKSTSQEQKPGYVHSYFQITNKGETRIAEHFWYNTWPDHGVPKREGQVYCDDVLTMLEDVHKAVKERAKDKDAPILVHCSAGVGRTGTFIAIDWAEKLMMDKGRVNLIALIRQLREDRVALVQTPDQYLFVHTAIQRYGARNGKKVKIDDGNFLQGMLYSPSLTECDLDEEPVPMAPIKPFKMADVGKPCTVRKYSSTTGVLMWIGMHAVKNQPRCGVVLKDSVGINDGSVTSVVDEAKGTKKVHRYFKCDLKYGLLTSPNNVTLLGESDMGKSYAPGMTPISSPAPEKADVSFEEMMEKVLELESGGGTAESSGDPDEALRNSLSLTKSDMEAYDKIWESQKQEGDKLSAGAAVPFFRTSGLGTAMLRAIWEEADSNEPLGQLNRAEFFIACKLISLRQAKIEPVAANLKKSSALPVFGKEKEKKKMLDGVEGGDEPKPDVPPRTPSSQPVVPTTPDSKRRVTFNLPPEKDEDSKPFEKPPPPPPPSTDTPKTPEKQVAPPSVKPSPNHWPDVSAVLVAGREAEGGEHYGDLIPRKMVDVTVRKKKAKEKLGLTLGGGKDSGDYTKRFIYVLGLAQDSLVSDCNLRKGDILSQINGENVENATLETAISMLKKASGDIVLRLARKQKRAGGASPIGNDALIAAITSSDQNMASNVWRQELAWMRRQGLNPVTTKINPAPIPMETQWSFTARDGQAVGPGAQANRRKSWFGKKGGKKDKSSRRQSMEPPPEQQGGSADPLSPFGSKPFMDILLNATEGETQESLSGAGDAFEPGAGTKAADANSSFAKPGPPPREKEEATKETNNNNAEEKQAEVPKAEPQQAEAAKTEPQQTESGVSSDIKQKADNRGAAPPPPRPTPTAIVETPKKEEESDGLSSSEDEAMEPPARKGDDKTKKDEPVKDEPKAPEESASEEKKDAEKPSDKTEEEPEDDDGGDIENKQFCLTSKDIVIYEKLWSEVDKTGEYVGASVAVSFLKTSGLAVQELRQIWGMVDKAAPKGKLNKDEFFAALKYVACVQCSLSLEPESLSKKTKIPRVGSLVSSETADDLGLSEEDRLVYSKLWDEVIPREGFVDAKRAVTFFQTSELPTQQLRAIWGLSDVKPPKGKLSQDEFYCALKLVALAQASKPVTRDALNTPSIPLPRVGSQKNSKPATDEKTESEQLKDLAISETDLEVYTKLWDEARVGNTQIPANKVVTFFQSSKLSTSTLRLVWKLSNTLPPKGSLSKIEFFRALKLVALAQASKAVDVSELQTPTPLPKVGSTATDTDTIAQPTKENSGPSWLKDEEKDTYNKLWLEASNNQSLIGASVAAKYFQTSGLETNVLRKIWNLSDSKPPRGKLDQQEFYVALKYIAISQKGLPLEASQLAKETPLPKVGKDTDKQGSEKKSETESLAQLKELISLIEEHGSKTEDGHVEVTAGSLARHSRSSIADITTLVTNAKRQSLLDFDVDALEAAFKDESTPVKLKVIPENLPEKPAALNIEGATVEESTADLPSNEERDAHYEKLWAASKPVDSMLPAKAAVTFFSKSGLPQKALREIWSLSDTTQPKGKLSKTEFYLAMDLIAMAQKGMTLDATRAKTGRESLALPVLGLSVPEGSETAA